MEDNLIDSQLGGEPRIFTLKILFGPMFGCELSLPADDYFIVIHPGLVNTTPSLDIAQEFKQTASFAHNALYIPSDETSPNLILRLKNKIESKQRCGYQIDIHDADGCDTCVVAENTLFCHDNICLAFKENTTTWSEAVTGYNRKEQQPSRHVSVERINSFNDNKRRALICAGLLLMLLLGGSGVAWYKHYRYESQIVALNVSLAGAPAPLKIIRAPDNRLYVFGDGHQEMVWLREVLYKLNTIHTAVPVWTVQAKKEIVKIMQRKGYPALQLDLSTPQHPQLSTYEKLNTSQQEALKRALRQEMPYADTIDIIYQNKEDLLKQAQQGLERLHIPYRLINTDNGYALVVKDALSDNALTTLRGFITDYYSQWGSKVINFSINLDENWLQDKSYLDAKGGYLFLNPLHWYFPVQHFQQHVQQQLPPSKGDA